MKIVIAAGGTGGHIYPGIAIAEEIRRRNPQAEILFIGSREGLEKDIIPREGYKLTLIAARALLRKLSYKSVTAPFVCFIGFLQSLAVLIKFRPSTIFATGGYVCLPVIAAAKILGIKIIIHEQNVIPGMVNKICSRFSYKTLLTFPESLHYIKGEVVGDPVRQAIKSMDRKLAREKLGLLEEKTTVLIMGGSQGSKKLNEIVISAAERIPEGFEFIHIIGNRDFPWVNNYLKGKKVINYRALPYVYAEMSLLLAAADLVVSRAGATAISELLIRGLPMILIPFPFASDNHQLFNAKAVAVNGAAIVVDEKDFSSDKLLSLLTTNSMDYVKMKTASFSLARPMAAERIVDILYG
ncbi:MAG: undecaprenyldiphospho-muramoylpentapeptide beta-N-acetylglucosaminyltransferase [Candidatus Margulisbacteria bacterium]|nr:undecaprenyldiphospho-muramoylpentapeptide beta-N-acetylglucosaminyltransferase [Candidatus Margulisiibacteriota bacterium]